MKYVANFFQFIIGFFLGVLVLAGGATAIAYVLFANMTMNPPKPIFAEEKQAPKAATPTPEKKLTKPVEKEVKPSPKTSPEVKKEDLPKGAYKAKVTWSSGLSIRSEPNTEASRVGGVDYNAEVVIIQSSADGKWQKIRLSDGQEGWVKSGNVEKVTE
jgi:uncharacterized protein YgiM (DUF1202 family)